MKKELLFVAALLMATASFANSPFASMNDEVSNLPKATSSKESNVNNTNGVNLPSSAKAEAINSVNPGISPSDTTKVIDIEEVVVIASPKEISKLRELPSSVSLISQKDMQAQQINSLKNISALTPNFFVPEYGSRITSAMYIRGVGSRLNTPAVGLYVDNIPYVDKSAFDFNFYDIERIDVLRGPQGTLYGRNTMGGLIKIHTKSPFSYQGTDLKLGYSTKDNRRSTSFTHYHRWSDKFAFSAGGYYEGSDGFFKNSYNGNKIGALEAGGGKIRAIYLPTSNLKLDFTVGYDYTDESGYPYFYTGTVKGKELYKDNIGKISYNNDSKYRRGLFNSGLNLQYQADKFIFNSVTGYQDIDDRMFLDQDFLPIDLYTLEQKQRINSLTQEFTFKSKNNTKWQWVMGASGLYQWNKTSAPVTFMKDGVDQMIEGNINSVFTGISASNPKAPQMSIGINNETLPVYGDFKMPTASGAIFHQSTFNNIFAKGLSLTLGARLEYERLSLDYNSCSDINFDFNINMMGMPMAFKNLDASPLLVGERLYDYLQFLPKAALKYEFNNKANIYASVSKGYRSGGYNVQMFSDHVSTEMKNKMIDKIKDEVIAALPNMLPPTMAGMIDKIEQSIVSTMPENEPINIDDTKYKPEYSWNYEVGTHLNLFNNKLFADFAAFYMDTHDQQITKFTGSGLGRIMVNAGKSRSYGAETSLRAAITKSLNISANYGYTHATFTDYDGGYLNITDADGNTVKDENGDVIKQQINYNGKYVPFVPKHTLNAGADYSFFMDNSFINKITLGAYYNAAGRIYWTESNTSSQSFYGTLNGNIAFTMKGMQVNFWGRNLTDKRYTTFYFETMNHGFEQISKPLQFGVDLSLKF